MHGSYHLRTRPSEVTPTAVRGRGTPPRPSDVSILAAYGHVAVAFGGKGGPIPSGEPVVQPHTCQLGHQIALCRPGVMAIAEVITYGTVCILEVMMGRV